MLLVAVLEVSVPVWAFAVASARPAATMNNLTVFEVVIPRLEGWQGTKLRCVSPVSTGITPITLCRAVRLLLADFASDLTIRSWRLRRGVCISFPSWDDFRCR